MFRYHLPIIIIGGKSLRMGQPKLKVNIKNKSFLDYILFLLFDVGFLFILNSGFQLGYLFTTDKRESIGPISSFYNIVLSYNHHFLYFLFICVDTPYIDKCSILNLIFNANKRFIVYYKYAIFPLIFPSTMRATLISQFVFFFNFKKTFSVFFFLNLLCQKNLKYFIKTKKI